ncbi:MAG TPA: hypothetical protein VEW03_00510 [Longimicrobiaceae bacterium]|nr:hypothetical protein [Longimicrobiaceae bacterium]
MDALNVDVTAMLAIWIAGVLLLVPVLGLAARLGLRPVLDSVARVRAAGRADPEAEERLTGLEDQFRALAGAVERLTEVLERQGAAQP